MTLDEWMTHWTKHRVRAYSTMEVERIHYGRYLKRLGDEPLESLTPMKLRRFFESLEEGFRLAKPPLGRPHTVRLCDSLLRTSLRDAVEAGVISVNPMESVKRPRVPRPEPKYLTLEEVQRLLGEVDRSAGPGVIGVHLLVRLGLRRGEALGLTWGDINLDSGEIQIRQQLQRVSDPDRPGRTRLSGTPLKTQGSARTLVADDELLRRLRALHESALTRSGPNDFVVAQLNGLPLDPDNFRTWLTKLGNSVDARVSPHRLRHTAATLMLNESIPLTMIGADLGHTNTATTLVYARVMANTKSAALQTLSNVLKA